MNLKRTRWIQRYENFGKAFLQFTDAIKRVNELNDLEKRGLSKDLNILLNWLGKH